MVEPYIRCLRCGAPIRRKGNRGVEPKYCSVCKIQRKRENTKKYRTNRKERQDDFIRMITSELPPSQVDEAGHQFIDPTHAQWDVIPTPYGTIQMIGTVTEWELSKRIHKLMKKVEEEKHKKET
jgi:hypothetical protein